MIPALPCRGFVELLSPRFRKDLKNPYTCRVGDFRFLCKAHAEKLILRATTRLKSVAPQRGVRFAGPNREMFSCPMTF